MKMIQAKHLILPILVLYLVGCRSNHGTERSEIDEELIEAMLYQHEFKVSTQIDDLIRNDQIDKLIFTDRVSNGTNQWTPLCFASFIGNRQAVVELIKNGANINFKDQNGQSPIILASIAGNIEELEVLLNNGADINDTDNNNSTPLIHAATDGNIRTVKFLVEKGCELNLEKGHNALDFAVFHQEHEVIKYLKMVYKE